MERSKGMDVTEKLEILADAAKYDAACTSSGVDRSGAGAAMGTARACGICHSFAGDGRCISLLKVLLSNDCCYDCAYCVNRRSVTTRRTSFEPRELADLTWQFYRRNYIEGLFLSSAVWRSPDYTCEQMLQVLQILREEYLFGGYIHVKVIPGADPLLIERLGYLADRISVNIELPSAASLAKLAPQKRKETLLAPMKQIHSLVAENTSGYGRFSGIQPIGSNAVRKRGRVLSASSPAAPAEGKSSPVPFVRPHRKRAGFAPAGQSTQMIIGASPESDRHILQLTERLYHAYDLKRVFYSAYVPAVESDLLPSADTPPPLWREHRLYQADWLLRFYGFRAEELLTPDEPELHPYLDPKCQWALRHPGFFPLEVNRAPYDFLLRVPGLGVESARRIVRARRIAALSWDGLKNIGVVLKRARYFLLCKGHRFPHLTHDRNAFLADMMSPRERALFRRQERDWEQPSLFGETALTGSTAAPLSGGAVPRLTDKQKQALSVVPIPLWE
jgi:putative DNA modification/repair radical SAM protein